MYSQCHFLVGVNLTGDSFCRRVEHLGVLGKAGEIPLSLLVVEGWVAPVELIALLRQATLLSLSLAAHGVTLSIGVTGRFESTFGDMKESDECCWNISSFFTSCPSALSSKCEG